MNPDTHECTSSRCVSLQVHLWLRTRTGIVTVWVRTPSLNEVLSTVRSMLKAVRGACVGLRFNNHNLDSSLSRGASLIVHLFLLVEPTDPTLFDRPLSYFGLFPDTSDRDLTFFFHPASSIRKIKVAGEVSVSACLQRTYHMYR